MLTDLGRVFCLLKTKSAAIISIVIVASKLTASWKKLWKYVVEIIISRNMERLTKVPITNEVLTNLHPLRNLRYILDIQNLLCHCWSLFLVRSQVGCLKSSFKSMEFLKQTKEEIQARRDLKQ